ncbi:MAG: hypothetical protein Q8R16_04450 [bacterium]|nr:hypothetical protein [bacterium]
MQARAILSHHRGILLYVSAAVATAFVLPTAIPLYYRLAFLAYAASLYWILRGNTWRSVSVSGTPTKTGGRAWSLLLVGSILFLVVSRLSLFARYGSAPLGYDTGFYVEYYRIISRALTIDPAVITTSHLSYASWLPYILLKLPPFFAINLLHVLHQLLTAGALYFLVRSLFPGTRARVAGAIAVFLFATSVNQFGAYWWMFYKQSMAIPFLLFAFGLLARRSFLAIPVGAFAVAVHLQSAVPFLAAFALVVISSIVRDLVDRRPLKRETWLLVTGFIAVVLLAFLFKGPRELRFYVERLLETGGTWKTVPAWRVEETKGLYVPLPLFLTNALLWAPFALFGITHLRRWSLQLDRRATELLVATFLVLAALTALPFIYQNRTLILLDLLLILFAIPPLRSLFSYPTTRAISVLFLAGALLTTSLTVIRSKPQVSPVERRELEQLGATLRRTGGYAMATDAMYAPWVYVFTEHETIAPGSLNWDRWELPEWEEFWNGDDDTHRHALLLAYDSMPIYLFVGDRQHIPIPLKRFLDEDPSMTQLSPHVWRYDGWPMPLETTPL